MNQTYLSSTKNTVLSLKPSKATRLLLMVLFVFITPLFSFGQSRTFTTSGTFVVPAGVTSINVEAWGSGAGGSDLFGGGGGAFAGNSSLAVIPGLTYVITVGAGGDSNSSGQDSSFGTTTTLLVNAKGAMGPYGGDFLTFSIGVDRYKGGNGGVNGGNTGAGGGGSGGSLGAGVAGGGSSGNWPGAGGTGGSGTSGAGGDGGGSGQSGQSGFNPGGGGGSAGNKGATNGKGGNGQVIITWTCPSYALTAAASATSICDSGSSTVILTSNTLPDGTYTVTYGTTNPATSGNIATMVFSGTTGTFTTKTLNATSTIEVIALSSGETPSICSSTISSNNMATVTVNAVSVGGTVSANQTICTGSSPSNITLTGNRGAIQWQSSANNSTWTAITGATASPLTSVQMGTLSAIRYYRAVVTSGSCAAATSATVTVTISPTSVAGTVSANQTICTGSSPSNITLTGNRGTIQWQSSANNSTWTAITGATASPLTSVQMGTLTAIRYYRAVVTNGSCAAATSATVTVTVSPTSVGGTISGGLTPICQGGSTGTLTLSGQMGTVVQWDKRLDSGSWGYAGGSSTTFSEIPYAAGTWEYRAQVQSGSCTSAYSTIQKIVVSPTPVGGNIDYATTPICINTATTLNLSGITGSVVQWEKRVNSGSWTTIANTATTLSETPSSSGNWEYRALVGSGSCAAVYSASRSIVVNPILTIALTSANASVCQNNTTATLSYTLTTGSPAQWQIDFDAAAILAGFSPSQTSGLAAAPGKITINVPWSAAVGIYKGNLTVITYSPSCSSVVYPISITVTVPPVVPSFGTATQPDCKIATGTVELSGLPASGTINQTGTVSASYIISGTSMPISGLVAGTYKFFASSGGCTSESTADIVIKPAVTNDWKVVAGVGFWSNGIPDSSQAIIFNGDYNENKDIEACSCTVTAGIYVEIESKKTLTLTNELIVNGVILFKDKSSLVQINSVKNTGNIKYERKISDKILPTDYVYWSSPVASFELGNVYIGNTSGLYYSYGVNAGVEDWQQELSATVMNPGKGYIINGAQAGGPSNLPLAPTFIGMPNNGDIIVPTGFTGVAGGTSNLLGNPYPSAIDADKFLTANSGVLEGTLYFWTHNTERGIGVSNAGTGLYAYSGDDYASYNFTGGVGAIPDVKIAIGNLPGGIVANENKDNKPSGKIAAGQGFFATSVAAGDLKFTNGMRVAGNASGNNSQFFKTKDLKGKTADVIEKNRVWLNLTNTQGAFKQTLIGYVTDATNDYDNLFDGESFDGNEFVDFYSVNQDKNLVIQGRALPFDTADEVPLGYRTTIDGNFTINIDEVDGSMTDQAVYIEDKLTNTVFNLKTGNYTFSTAPGTFNDRFVLKYMDTSKTLGAENFNSSTNEVLVSNANKQIKINAFADTIDKVVIYDLLGRQIYQKTNVNSNELSISNVVSSRQVVIVKTLLQNGQEVSKKIVY